MQKVLLLSRVVHKEVVTKRESLGRAERAVEEGEVDGFRFVPPISCSRKWLECLLSKGVATNS